MLHDLEVYLYSDGYGPTNEKLGVYLRDLFHVRDPRPPAALSSPPPPAGTMRRQPADELRIQVSARIFASASRSPSSWRRSCGSP
jgi:hypothetical protein